MLVRMWRKGTLTHLQGMYMRYRESVTTVNGWRRVNKKQVPERWKFRLKERHNCPSKMVPAPLVTKHLTKSSIQGYVTAVATLVAKKNARGCSHLWVMRTSNMNNASISLPPHLSHLCSQMDICQRRKKILLPAQPCNLPPGPFLGNPEIVSAEIREM